MVTISMMSGSSSLAQDLFNNGGHVRMYDCIFCFVGHCSSSEADVENWF